MLHCLSKSVKPLCKNNCTRMKALALIHWRSKSVNWSFSSRLEFFNVEFFAIFIALPAQVWQPVFSGGKVVGQAVQSELATCDTSKATEHN